MNRIGLTIAFVFAAMGAAFLLVYKQRFEAQVQGGAKVSVLMVLEDLAPGTRITREHLGVRELPERYVEGRHIRAGEAASLVGVRVANALRANETVLWTDVATTAMQSRHLSNLVPPGMRALSVVAEGSSFGGLLNPGDRVDALLTIDGVGKTKQTKMVAQNLLVLAVGDDLGQEPAQKNTRSNMRQTVVSLAVSVEDAQRLTLASREGMVSLLLRNTDDLRQLDEVASTQSRDVWQTRGVHATTASNQLDEELRGFNGLPPEQARALIEAAVRAPEHDDPESQAAVQKAFAALGIDPSVAEDATTPKERKSSRRKRSNSESSADVGDR